MTFRELIASVGKAGAEAHASAADDATRRRIDRHFEKIPHTDTWRAKTIRIELASGAVVDMPTFLLELPERFALRSFEMEMETDIRLPKSYIGGWRCHPNDATVPAGSVPEIEVGLTRGLNKRSSHVKIKAKFRLGTPTEGASLLQQVLNDQLRSALAGDLPEEMT